MMDVLLFGGALLFFVVSGGLMVLFDKLKEVTR